MKYESLIFDIDGTLWDSRELVAQGFNLQLEKEGLERYFVDAERLKPLFGRVMTEIADNIFPDLPAAERYALIDRCEERETALLHADKCQIGYPGAAETLACLAENHRLFIVSNSQQGYPELCMEKLGLGKWIAGHMCFGDTGTDKGTTIRRLMEKYNITSAAYVGDTEGDRQASEKAGIDFLWAAYGFGTVKAYRQRLSCLSDLARLEREGKL